MFIRNFKMNLSTLTNFFIKTAGSKATKRQIEWLYNDFVTILYVIFCVIVVCTWISLGTWWMMLIAAIGYMAMLVGFATIVYQVRKTLLNMLYPPVKERDENGDGNIDIMSDLMGLLQPLQDEAFFKNYLEKYQEINKTLDE